MRLEIRLALLALITGVAAAVLAGRKPSEHPLSDNELAQGTESAQPALESDADSWFI